MQDDDRPLQDEEIRKLRVLRPFLLVNICMQGLLDHLLAAACISQTHFDGVSQQVSDHGKVREMLAILERQSYKNLNMFVSCLKSTHQGHVAREIERTGGKYCCFVYSVDLNIKTVSPFFWVVLIKVVSNSPITRVLHSRTVHPFLFYPRVYYDFL